MRMNERAKVAASARKVPEVNAIVRHRNVAARLLSATRALRNFMIIALFHRARPKRDQRSIVLGWAYGDQRPLVGDGARTDAAE